MANHEQARVAGAWRGWLGEFGRVAAPVLATGHANSLSLLHVIKFAISRVPGAIAIGHL